MTGLLKETRLLRGDRGKIEENLSFHLYKSRTAAGATIYLPGADAVGGGTTTYDYADWAGFQPRTVTTHLPTVNADRHGTGDDEITTEYDAFGRVTWTFISDEFATFTGYDPATGAVRRTEVVMDSGPNLVTLYSNFDEAGRPGRMIDPNGNDTDYLYSDTLTERTATTLPPAGASVTVRHDLANLTVDTFTGPESAKHSWTRQFTDHSGRVLREERYHDIANNAFYTTRYSTSVPDGTIRVVDATGTITKTVLDALGRPIQKWIGTSEANAVKVETREYDGGGIGNGNVTKITLHPGTGPDRVTHNRYDWRDRLVITTDTLSVTHLT